jgi:hypothetical protein
MGTNERMRMALKGVALNVYYMVLVSLIMPASVFASEWHLAAHDTACEFTCDIPLKQNSDFVIDYIWRPEILKKLSGRISKTEVLSTSKDTQKVIYTFYFFNYKSNATYLRYKSSQKTIESEQLSFSSNMALWPVPVCSRAKYSIDTLHQVKSLHYYQIVVFNKTLKPWDVFYSRIVLSYFVSDLEKILKEFTEN